MSHYCRPLHAAAHLTPSFRTQLEGEMDRLAISLVDSEGLHLVGVKLDVGAKLLPQPLLNLLRGCKAGVLVVK